MNRKVYLGRKYNLIIVKRNGYLKGTYIDGLTKAEAAIRASSVQSTVCCNERESSMPTKGTFEALPAACSKRMKPSDLLQGKRSEILELVRTVGATYVKVFGSVSRGSDDIDSDLDLLVDVPPNVSIFQPTELRLQLEDLVGTSVDLVTPQGIRPELRDNILNEAKQI